MKTLNAAISVNSIRKRVDGEKYIDVILTEFVTLFGYTNIGVLSFKSVTLTLTVTVAVLNVAEDALEEESE